MYSRKALLAAIHIGKAALAMSDEDYRAMLNARYKVESAAKLSLHKLEDLMRHMEKLGFVPARRPSPRREVHPLCRKVWAQCYSLSRPVPQYADALAAQMYGVEKLVWLDEEQLRGIVAALARQQRREAV